MKTPLIQFCYTFLAIVYLAACEQTEDLLNLQSRKVIVEFSTTQLSINENQEHYYIRMPFNKTAVNGGLITLAISNFDTSRIRVLPALNDGRLELIVDENREFATLHLMPIDNSLSDGDLAFNISIIDTCPNFAIGARSTISVMLTDDEAPSLATLTIPDGGLNEKNIAGKTAIITFSRPLASPGSMSISLSSANAIYGTHYITEPAATGGLILLDSPLLATSASFKIVPVDNSTLTGHFDLVIAVASATGSIIKGPQPPQRIQILDDELASLPKSYSIDGQWGLKKMLEYDQHGRIQFVRIEKSTPVASARIETYFYDAEGRISRVNMYPQIDRIFTWTNGRITRSENVEYGVVKGYIDYDYDDNGNVSGAASYFKLDDGTFQLGFLNTYIYFNDNNLYKQQTYITGNEPDEFVLLSTRTFEDYLEVENPFPMVDILPNIRTQTKLPGRYTLEEHGLRLDYTMSYGYTPDGLVKTRIARSGSDSEVTTYDYY